MAPEGFWSIRLSQGYTSLMVFAGIIKSVYLITKCGH